MSARHLGRVISEILAVVDLTAKKTEEAAEALFEERKRMDLAAFAADLIRKAPEQIRPSAWDHAEPLVLEVMRFLDEPQRGLVEAMWTGLKDEDVGAWAHWPVDPDGETCPSHGTLLRLGDSSTGGKVCPLCGWWPR